MEKNFKQVSAFDWKLSAEHFEGKFGASECVPSQAISIKDIVRKSIIGAPLPPVYFENELDSEDEGFESASEYPEDKLAVMDKGSYLRNYVKTIEDAKKAAIAKNSQNEAPTLPDGKEDKPES